MPKEQSAGKPTTRRYSPEEKAAAVRMVRTLRAELGTSLGTVARVANQLGYGVESVRSWVRQADIDEGVAPGMTTAESARVKQLEQENRELKRANEILKRAASFFSGGARAANTRNSRLHRRQPGGVRGRAHLHRTAQRRSVGGPEHLLRHQDPATAGAGSPRRRAGTGAAQALGGQLPRLRSPQAVESRTSGRPRHRP